MLFNSYAFLMVFLPLVMIAYLAFPHRTARLAILIVSSLIFYGVSGLEHAVVLFVGIVWTYALTSGAIAGRRTKLILALAGPLGALIYYKYLGFILVDLMGLDQTAAADMIPVVDSSLPAGISFFTFQMMAYALDRYRGHIPEKPDFRGFAAYIAMFPQLIAGPILRYGDVSGALVQLSRFRLTHERALAGLYYIAVGLAAKVLLADQLARQLGSLVADPGTLGSLGASYVILAYSFQIYFDFYGYSLVAIGLGKLLGFDFPANFLRPYESLNARDFWRRWHVTLSFWIRDYLYLPLGGNRSYARNIIIVFAVCGLWHGAGLNFIVWGLYHGALVASYKYMAPLWDRAPALVQRTMTFVLVSLGWTLFLFDFDGALQLMTSLVSGNAGVAHTVSLNAWVILCLAAAVCFGINFETLIARSVARCSLVVSCGLGAALVTVVVLLERSTDFIYFRF